MTISLPPFSGDEVACQKCQRTGAGTTYRAEGESRSGGSFTAAFDFPMSQRVERLQRNCLRCGFVWDEAIVQPAPAEPTP